MLRILCVCGARPNFIKIAPVVDALRRVEGVALVIVHTGQHYDERMSGQFFGELNIPQPDVNLKVGSCSHAAQTAEIMKRFEPVCLEHKPDWVVVVADVNSTIAAALVAVKLGIKVAHIEAGLRSFDRTMPEEINRILTDSISDLLFVTEPSGVANLKRAVVDANRIHLVGNVMIDTLRRSKSRADASTILSTLGVEKGKYALTTLHRPANVDNAERLSSILRALEEISRDMPVIFPMHPRSRSSIDATGLSEQVASIENLHTIEPLGYLDFLNLMSNAAVVLTDSGGIQEETTILGVPCLTLRDNTERPITIDQGTNRLTGSGTDAIVSAYRAVRDTRPKGTVPELWDGHAAERIVDILTGVKS